MLAGELVGRRQLVLHRAEFVQCRLQLGRQQLSDDGVERLECQASTGDVDLSRRRHDVRLVAGVHDQSLPIDAEDRLEK